MTDAKGGCLCGAVRFCAKGAPVMVAACHCATCQKNTGSAFSINVAYPADAVTFSGDSLVTYIEHASVDTAPFNRSFCSRCGSPISGHGEAYPGIVFIKAGTLDDPSWVRPTLHMWCGEKQPWVKLDDTVPHLPAGPDA